VEWKIKIQLRASLLLLGSLKKPVENFNLDPSLIPKEKENQLTAKITFYR
jgi:hypothetical protein